MCVSTDLNFIIEKSGYTQKQFEDIIGYKGDFISDLSKGYFSFDRITLAKARHIFTLLDVPVRPFYNKYYPELRKQVSLKLKKWRLRNSRNMFLPFLRKIYLEKIKHLRNIKSVPSDVLNDLVLEYEDLFLYLESTLDSEGCVSLDVYNHLIMEFSYKIRSSLEQYSPDKNKAKNIISCLVDDAVLHSEYDYDDLSYILDVNRIYLKNKKIAPDGYERVKMGTLIKLFYVLDVDYSPKSLVWA